VSDSTELVEVSPERLARPARSVLCRRCGLENRLTSVTCLPAVRQYPGGHRRAGDAYLLH
jgi:hypothetical protein